MQRNHDRAPSDAWQLRIMLVDDHAVSRAACRALLRTEGVDVVADLALDHAAIAIADELRPTAVIIDVTPVDQHGLELAGRLQSLPHAPIVLLTSSADCAMFDHGLDGSPFIAKADLCSEAILTAIHAETHISATNHAREEGPQLG